MMKVMMMMVIVKMTVSVRMMTMIVTMMVIIKVAVAMICLIDAFTSARKPSLILSHDWPGAFSYFSGA